jgi:hypothetical protein
MMLILKSIQKVNTLYKIKLGLGFLIETNGDAIITVSGTNCLFLT